MALNNEAMESMLKAMDIIAGYRLNDVSYDRTIICTIVDDSDAKNGKYLVSDGSIKFYAYTETETYKKNDNVRVSIPNGDFSETKYIEGKSVEEDSVTPITYLSPLDSVVEMVNLTSGGTQQALVSSLTANKVDATNPNGISVYSWTPEDSTYAELQASGVYNTLALSAEFKTLLGKERIKSGTYGLRIDLAVRANSTNTNTITKSFYLKTSDMFGDPYGFNIYAPQVKTFDLENVGIIDRITVYFFQDNDFTYYNNKSIIPYPVKPTPNIFVKNISISFGNEMSKVEDDTVQLYTSSSPTYKYLLPTDDTNRKEIGFIWNNKTEENEYLGFKDGIVEVEDGEIVNYDEIEYLTECEENTRLSAQKSKTNIPTDKNGLEISANLEDFSTLIPKISKKITQDLNNTLKAFKERLSGIAEASVLTDITKTELQNIADQFEEVAVNVKDYFTKALLYGAQVQDYQSDNSKTITAEQPTYQNYLQKIEEIFSELNSLLYTMDSENSIRVKFMETIQSAISEKYQSFQGIYDTYKIRVNKLFTEFDSFRSKIKTLLDGKEQLVLTYNPNTAIVAYIDKDFSGYANKYCVYWYRYVPGYIDTNERFAATGWKRLDEIESNLGLPSTYWEDGSVKYFNERPETGEGLLSIYLDPNTEEEKFMVILFYNHEMFKSGELVFRNLDEIPDTTTLDKNGSVFIEHNKNSLDCYQTLYGSNMSLLNSADGLKHRELIAEFKQDEENEEALRDAQIYWYVPKDTTMLTVDVSKLQNEGFSTDYYTTVKVTEATKILSGPKEDDYDEVREAAIDEVFVVYGSNNGYYSLKKNNIKGEDGEWIKIDKTEVVISDYHRNGFICFYKQIANIESDLIFYYKIKDYYTESAIRNTVFCVIEKGGESFEGDLSFTFGTQGTSGTDYTLKVGLSGSQAAVRSDIGLALDVTLRNYKNELLKMYSKYKENSTDLVEIIIDGESGFDTRVEWMGPTSYNMYLTTNLEDDTVTGGQALLLPDQSYYCGIAKVITSFSLNDNGESNNKRISDLTAFYPIPWTVGDYYIEGASYVIYDSQGVNPSYYKDPYKIYNANTSEEITNVKWEIKCFKGKDGEAPSLLDLNDENTSDLYKSYMPVINDKNGLTPPTMFIDGMDCYPVVYCYYEDNDEMPIWAQPIVIIQNRYPSTMLNSWDGSLTIDEKNGTIISAMMGAGRKTSNNTFEGVLMGDIEAGSGMDLSENKSGLGIYGFNDGAQSFGFNVDGTAFIGKSGRGRIKFNGDNGTISSASFEQLKATGDSGMKIDLDDGIIDIYGTGVKQNGSYSLEKYHPHIRLSATAKNAPYFLITTPNCTGNDEWKSKPLISIGKTNYYLQSENYKATSFIKEDGAMVSDDAKGSGMKIDLQNGKLDAYNLQITSKNLFLDSGDGANPIFIIKDNDGCNLIYAAQEHFYIQSHSNSNFQRGIKNDDGTFSPGVKINIHPTGSDNLLMDIRGNTQSIFYIGTDKYYLQSNDYTLPANSADGVGHGMKIDLANGKISSYNFSLKGENSNAGSINRGSYIQINSDPTFRVRLKDSANSYDLNLINITPESFYLQSKNWNSGTSSNTTQIKIAKVLVNSLNVRSKPSTEGSIVGSLSKDDEVQVYGSSVNGWWSLDSTQDQTSGQWAYEGDSKNYLKVTTTTEDDAGVAAGMKINVLNGEIVMHKDAQRSLIIDSGRSTFPLQIGKKLPTSTTNTSTQVRNFRVSWDGAVYGGSTYKWSITSDGIAKFNKMIANSGSLDYMGLSNTTISSGTIGGCTIKSGSISGSGWSLSKDGAVFSALTVGDYEFTPKMIQYGCYVPAATTSSGAVQYEYLTRITPTKTTIVDKNNREIEVVIDVTPTVKQFTYVQRSARVVAAEVSE